MLFETLTAITAGIFLGIISGLIPGIHINLIASLSILFYNRLSTSFPAILIIIALTSMLITAIFLNFIPSLILGVPDSEKTAIIKPLHRAILKGRAYFIIKQVAIMLLITSLTSIILLPILYIIITKTKNLTALVPLILILILLLNLKNEKNKALALAIMLLAGFLGIIAFSTEPLKDPLLPLLSGLFGISSIIDSLSQPPKFKKQFFSNYTKLPKKELKNLPFYTILISSISFIPAISSSQIVSIIKKDTKTYLLACSSFTIATALISFITVYTLNKARSGVAVASISYLGQINQINLLLIIATVIITAAVASILLIKFSKLILKNLEKIPYKKLSISVLIIITAIIITISGIYGIIIAALATLLGIICTKFQLNRNYLMASLIIPTIFYFL